MDVSERNQEATLFVGELDAAVNESLLWELFLQVGPVGERGKARRGKAGKADKAGSIIACVALCCSLASHTTHDSRLAAVNVHIPRDKVSNEHQSFGFVEMHSVLDADYAMKVLNGVRLFGRPIRVNKSNRDTRTADIGANLFVGNLDPDVDEHLLQTTFAVFGALVGQPKIMREPETGKSRGFGFVSYDAFDAADAAIATMNGQYICNRPITVSFALKKDGKGERHGTETERMLAAQQAANRPAAAAGANAVHKPLMPSTFMPAMMLPPGAFGGMMGMPMPTMMAPVGLAGPMAMGFMPQMSTSGVPMPQQQQQQQR